MEPSKDFKDSEWYIEARKILAKMNVSDIVVNELFPVDCDEDTAIQIMEHVMWGHEII